MVYVDTKRRVFGCVKMLIFFGGGVGEGTVGSYNFNLYSQLIPILDDLWVLRLHFLAQSQTNVIKCTDHIQIVTTCNHRLIIICSRSAVREYLRCDDFVCLCCTMYFLNTVQKTGVLILLKFKQ